jgi:thioredoxin 1
MLHVAKGRPRGDAMSTDLNRKTFEEFVAEGVALVDFWAPWCGPCRMQLPILEEVAESLPELKIGKVNVDESGELAVQFGINTIPYLAVFKEGHKIGEFIGLRQADFLVDAIKTIL